MTTREREALGQQIAAAWWAYVKGLPGKPLPQQALGLKVGRLTGERISKGTVSKWFSGTSEPTARQFVAIAQVCGTTVEAIVKAAGEMEARVAKVDGAHAEMAQHAKAAQQRRRRAKGA